MQVPQAKNTSLAGAISGATTHRPETNPNALAPRIHHPSTTYHSPTHRRSQSHMCTSKHRTPRTDARAFSINKGSVRTGKPPRSPRIINDVNVYPSVRPIPIPKKAQSSFLSAQRVPSLPARYLPSFSVGVAVSETGPPNLLGLSSCIMHHVMISIPQMRINGHGEEERKEQHGTNKKCAYAANCDDVLFVGGGTTKDNEQFYKVLISCIWSDGHAGFGFWRMKGAGDGHGRPSFDHIRSSRTTVPITIGIEEEGCKSNKKCERR
ncbi:hypothetical protein BJ912DRAFT_288696 [Pholiota molesta]|nr:hypothetical protein BJ912DRAFT_288696 [Pholiota molesta]